MSSFDQKSKVQASVHKKFGVDIDLTPKVHFDKKKSNRRAENSMMYRS